MATAEEEEMMSVRVDVHEGIVIRHGDTLLVRVNPTMNLSERDRLRNQVSRDLPGVKVVLVPADQLVVKRGPQLDQPARPLVEASVPVTTGAQPYDPTRPGFAQGRLVF